MSDAAAPAIAARATTRDCLDPWTYVEVRVNGDVAPCCVRGPVGNIAEASLAEILSGEPIRKLRAELAAGELDAICAGCRQRAPITPEALHEKIRAARREVQLPPGFAADAYLRANPDLAGEALDAEWHFRNFGYLEGRPVRPEGEPAATEDAPEPPLFNEAPERILPPAIEAPVQPVTVQPVTVQPVTVQPVTAQPVTAQPLTAQPAAGLPFDWRLPASVLAAICAAAAIWAILAHRARFGIVAVSSAGLVLILGWICHRMRQARLRRQRSWYERLAAAGAAFRQFDDAASEAARAPVEALAHLPIEPCPVRHIAIGLLRGKARAAPDPNSEMVGVLATLAPDARQCFAEIIAAFFWACAEGGGPAWRLIIRARLRNLTIATQAQVILETIAACGWEPRRRDRRVRAPAFQHVAAVAEERPTPTAPDAVDNRGLQALIARVEQKYAYLGETEPHWSVLTVDKFTADNIAQHEAEFFASGRIDVERLMDAARRNGVAPPRSGTCFELGCGVGRHTVQLADLFDTVIAADVSPPHLALAAQAVARASKQNVRFLRVDSVKIYDDLPQFDLFFSMIVLQHNPPPLMEFMLRQILRKLRPGGLGYFQIPTGGSGYTFSLDAHLAEAPNLAALEMHVMPEAELCRLIDEEGCRLLEMSGDNYTGPSYTSQTVLLQKSG